MKLIYFVDAKLKPFMLKGVGIVNPEHTKILDDGISSVREFETNFWLYSKNGTTIAFDSGHLNYPNIKNEFQRIGINSCDINHIFLTHADVDHAGGIDKCGENIFPNAKVYLGKEEEQYITGQTFRFKKGFIKVKNCVKLNPGYILLSDNEQIDIEGIKIEIIHTPGHTMGHICYIIDDFILISGDTLAINDNGGYSFFGDFCLNPELNKRSLFKLKAICEKKPLKWVLTGHSGCRKYSPSVFQHIEETAVFSKKTPFDKNAPYNTYG